MHRRYFTTVLTAVIFFCTGHLHAADTLSVSFTASAVSGGATVTPDSVRVVNVTQNVDTTLYGPGYALPLHDRPSGIIGAPVVGEPVFAFRSGEDAATGEQEWLVTLPDDDRVCVAVYRVDGGEVASFSRELTAGMHAVVFKAPETGFYITALSCSRGSIAGKAPVLGGAGGAADLRYEGRVAAAAGEPVERPRAAQTAASGPFLFKNGDVLEYTAWAAGYISAGMADAPAADTSYEFLFDQPAAVIYAGDSVTVTLNKSVSYRVHPDSSISILRTPGLTVTGIEPSCTDTGLDARHGAMWEPYAGQPYTRKTDWGFDGRLANSNYNPAFNVAPAAAGSALVINGDGSLVIAVSRSESLSTAYTPQRSAAGQVVKRYKVVNFVSELPPAGSFRAPVRGAKKHYPDWTEANVLSRLDAVYPRQLNLQGVPGWDTDDKRAKRLLGLEGLAAQGTFATAYSSEPLAAAEGVAFYGSEWSQEVGKGILDLADSATTPGDRRRLALALVQTGIDLAGIVRDSGYWQCNGGHTHGRIMAVLAAGLLMDDPYLVAMATDPLGSEIAPGQSISVYPFSEQRTLGQVAAIPRTEGTDPAYQAASWGHTVGTGSFVPLAPEWEGQWWWCIAPDRGNMIASNTMFPTRSYWAINSRWHTLATLILQSTRPGGYDLSALDGIRASGAQSVYNYLEYQDGSNPSRGTLEQGYSGLVPYIDYEAAWTGPPCIAIGPYLTEGAGTFSAKYHGWQPAYGSPITARNLRYRLNGGAWTTVSGYTENAAVTHGGADGDTLEVQVQAVNANGPGPWSSNEPGAIIDDPEDAAAPLPGSDEAVATLIITKGI